MANPYVGMAKVKLGLLVNNQYDNSDNEYDNYNVNNKINDYIIRKAWQKGDLVDMFIINDNEWKNAIVLQVDNCNYLQKKSVKIAALDNDQSGTWFNAFGPFVRPYTNIGTKSKLYTYINNNETQDLREEKETNTQYAFWICEQCQHKNEEITLQCFNNKCSALRSIITAINVKSQTV